MWIARISHPEILPYTQWLAEFNKNPTECVLRKALMLLEYMLYWVDIHRIVLRPTSLSLVGYFDAAYLPSWQKKSRSRYGVVIGFPGAMFIFESIKSPNVPLSTAEAELCAGHYAARSVEWVGNLCESVGIKLERPVSLKPSNLDDEGWTAELGNDNVAAEIIAKKGYAAFRTGRHIEARWFYLANLIKRGRVALSHVSSSELPADLLTKFLDEKTFFKHLAVLLGVDITLEPTK
jgi:hypothetical protein